MGLLRVILNRWARYVDWLYRDLTRPFVDMEDMSTRMYILQQKADALTELVAHDRKVIS